MQLRVNVRHYQRRTFYIDNNITLKLERGHLLSYDDYTAEIITSLRSYFAHSIIVIVAWTNNEHKLFAGVIERYPCTACTIVTFCDKEQMSSQI